MHIVLCPDSFKGSLSSPAVAQAMADGILQEWPDSTLEIRPMADGGEGMAAIVNEALGGKWQQTLIHGPEGRPVLAKWGYDPQSRQAVIEVASACGLSLLTETNPDIWRRDTYGVGELILAALDTGATQMLIGLGGSGTNDAGAGMLAALGVVFKDVSGHPLPPNPGALGALYEVDFHRLAPRLAATQLIVLTDVDNPLTGAQGASAVFGPQKGLPRHQINEMDARIYHIARRIAGSHTLPCSTDQPGTGAAGGLGFALMAVLGATRHIGSRYIADLIGLDDAIARADLIITGEGNLDAQTLAGKVVAEVAHRAGSLHKPVIAIAGAVHISVEEIHNMGLTAAWSLCTAQISCSEAMTRSRELIAERTKQAVHDWRTSQSPR
jgi:glycerate kinase